MTRFNRSSSIGRRTVLRGMFGSVAVGLALPTLDIMLDGHGTAYASGGALPKRFGIFFWGNGVRLKKWVPSQAGAGWMPPEELSPLADIKDYVSVVSGCNVKTGGRGHHTGTVAMLAAAPYVEQEPQNGANYASTFPGPSMDQVVADAIGKDTRLRSLELGIAPRVSTSEGTTLRYLSHNGPDNVNPAQYKPRAVFDRLFGPGLEPADTTRLELRRSVLDAVLSDANALKTRVGTTDKARIDQHLDSVRSLEHQLEQLEQGSGYPPECKLPDVPPDVADDDYAELTRLMSQLLSMALVCDLTRVFTIHFSGSVCGDRYPQVGANDGHHGLTHNEAGEQPKVNAITKYTIAQLNTFLTDMHAMGEGSGNLLDSLALLATTDVAEGQPHSRNDFPILVAGRCRGALVHPGIHYRSPNGETTSNVHITLAKALDLGVDSYGSGVAKSEKVVAGLLT